jgi:hypothetical protein
VVAIHLVLNQIDNGPGESLDIAEFKEPSPSILEYLLGIPVRCRDNGLPHSHGIGQGSAGDLFLRKIRRYIDVTGPDELAELLKFDKSIVEKHVLFQSKLDDLALKGKAVLLAMGRFDCWMCCSKNNIRNVRNSLHHLRKGFENGFNALVRI